MPKNRPDEQRVYMALRREFLNNPPGKKTASIRKRLAKCTETPELTSLIREYNSDNVSSVAKKLLNEGIYHSTLQAKLRFPELFEVSPAQSADREASEAEAARNEAQCLHNVIEQDAVQGPMSPTSARAPKEVMSGDVLREGTPVGHSLYPIYLPQKTQHRILAQVQDILEAACFDFGSNELRHVLEQKGWDCAECVELNVWTGIFKTYEALFTELDLQSLGKPYGEFLRSIANLRHTAVHRVRATAKSLEQFLQDAEGLVGLFKNNDASVKLVRIRQRTQLSIGELERSKELLGTRIAAMQKNFARQRADLDSREKATLAEIFLEDSNYQRSAGERLEDEIHRASLGHCVDPVDEDETDGETQSVVSELGEELDETLRWDGGTEDERSAGTERVL